MLGCFKTIHLIWGTFTSEALTFSLWLTCRPSSLWATVVSCLAMAIDNSDQGIFIHTATLSSFILAIGKRTWICIINLVIYACKSLWPLQQCACIVFLPHVGAKDEKLFFFVLVWMPCWKCHWFICSILKQSEPGRMEKYTQRKLYKLNGHLSALLLMHSFATFPNSFPE